MQIPEGDIALAFGRARNADDAFQALRAHVRTQAFGYALAALDVAGGIPSD